MNELIKLGISEDTIKEMLEHNINIKDLTDQDIIDKENLLKEYQFSDNQILNVISSNPYFLSEDNIDIKSVFEKLSYLGFKCLNILIDSPKELSNYIKGEVAKGKEFSEIIDYLESNPDEFNEI